jgi:hypothetical protein
MISSLYSQLDLQILPFLETLPKKFGMNTKTNLMRLEFPSKPVFSQVSKTLTQELDSMLEITVLTEYSINFSIKSLRSIMAMDQMQFTILT